MTIKSDCLSIAEQVNALDHSAPGVQTLHDTLWSAVHRNREILGLSEADLQEIGNAGNVQARGGGTPKTPPPPE